MLIVMLAAFIRAGIAYSCAKLAYFFNAFAAKAHQFCRSIANGCTLHIKLYTGCTKVCIGLMRTGRSAMVANGRTTKAGVDT